MFDRKDLEGKSVIMFAVLIIFQLIYTSIADSTTTVELLWPQPESMKFGSAVYSIDSSFSFLSDSTDSSILRGAFARYQHLIFETPTPFYPSGGATSPKGTLNNLTVIVSSSNETLQLKTDESYTLTVTGGIGSIKAVTVFGALRGIETFSQLIYRTSTQMLAINEVIEIKDKPRFNYRGTMIDSARHFLNVKTILHHLDAMSYNKLNVLHWHIVDDQSFPYMSKTFPNITAKGAYDSRHVYSQEDIAAIISHAKDRGIRVIPEFDTPGHSKSWGKGVPNLLTPCYSKSGTPDGSYGPINPILNSTWSFMKMFYQEVSEVFPDDYVHLGGDEVSYKCWESNPDIKAWMKEKGYTDYSKLEEYYEANLLEIVESLNRSYVGWQEIFDNGLKIKKDTVIDVWKGGWEKEMNAVTKAGYNAILSACWYLSQIHLGPDWKNYYQCDPQQFNGTEAQNSLVVGGHACIWGEYVDSTNFLPRYWPRASAVAERLWSPKSVTKVENATTRIHNQKCRMMSRGIPAEPANGPSYCAFEWPDSA